MNADVAVGVDLVDLPISLRFTCLISSYTWLVCLQPTAHLAGRKDCGKYQQLVLLILSFLS